MRYRFWKALLFLFPSAILLGLFVIWPLLRGVFWSFTNADLINSADCEWVGFSNYGSLISDPRFRQAFANTALFALMVVPLQTTAAFFLALWVNRPQACFRWLRVVFFIPVVVAMPVLAVLWTILYQPAQGGEMGLINACLSAVGIAPQAWLRDPSLALPSIAVMSIWQGLGLQMMVFLAGLQHIPRELIDAASIDGAGAWRRLWHVIIPGMMNSIVFVITVTTILAFRLFVQPYLMTRGGPEGRTLSVIQYIYESTFIDRDLARACAGAIIFLVLVALLTLLQRVLTREARA
jgi:ABC-type sugar transport system permease subunit